MEAGIKKNQYHAYTSCMHRILRRTWQRTWTTLATRSSTTPVLGSSIVRGVRRLWHCDVHAPGHGGAGVRLGHGPCLNTEPIPLHVATHRGGVPPQPWPSRPSPPGG